MAQNTRMQQRYGTYSQFLADKNNLLPHEFASIASGDPNTSDGKSLNFAFGPGDTKRLMTAEDAQDEIRAAASQATADAEESAQKAQDYYNKIAPAVENAKDELDNYTDALKGTIPLDYTELSEKVQQMEITKAPVIQGKDSGEFVTLSDSGDIPTKNVRLFGKSVQAETTGVQLFDISTAKNYDEAEITDYSSGTMEIEQNNSAMTQSPKLKEWCPTMQAGQSYLLTCETTSTKKYITIGSSQWNFGGIFIPTADDLEENVEWHCTTQRSTAGDIVYYRDTFAGIMIVEGSTEKPYEVYTGGEAATEPTPEFPLPITSAGNYAAEEEKYEVGIGVTGKNLFDASKVPTKTQSGATVTNNGDGSFTISGSGNLSGEFADNYRISHNDMVKFFKTGTVKMYTEKTTHPYFYVNLFKDNKFLKTLISSSQVSTGQFELKEEYFEDESYSLYMGINGNNNAVIVPGTIKPVIYQEGDGTWEPFKQQLSTLQIPNPFRGIPVDSGGNYTDADGQQWISDVVDLEAKTLTRYCKIVTYDGSSDEIWIKRFEPSTFNIGVADRKGTAAGVYPLICNRFKTISNAISVGDMENGTIKENGTKGETSIYFKNESCISLEDWKTWLQSNTVTVLYQLATPTTTPLTPDQLSALNLSTYQGITNIGTDTMPQVGVEVEYGCDTKIYIDNKFTELAQSLAATQNQILGGN